jgi:hypothetical protein
VKRIWDDEGYSSARALLLGSKLNQFAAEDSNLVSKEEIVKPKWETDHGDFTGKAKVLLVVWVIFDDWVVTAFPNGSAIQAQQNDWPVHLDFELDRSITVLSQIAYFNPDSILTHWWFLLTPAQPLTCAQCQTTLTNRANMQNTYCTETPGS